MFKKLLIAVLSVYLLAGCNLLDRFNIKSNDKKEQEARPVVVNDSHRKPTNNNNKPNNRRKPVAEQPSLVKEEPTKEEPVATIEDDTNNNSMFIETKCIYNNSDVLRTLNSLAEQSITSFQTRIPNITMVHQVTIGHDVCYDGSSLTEALKKVISKSNRFELINSSLESRIKSQLKQASNSYVIRIAKAQNIDYLFTGSVNKSSSSALVVLKVTDVKTGTVVWQRSQKVK